MGKINTILLIEDDNITNFINDRLLTKLEVAKEIKQALNGLEGIKFIKSRIEDGKKCPQLIFLDINMPIMDGFEFLSEFNSLNFKGKDDVKIIMLTTSTNLSDIDKLKQSCNTDYINKPLTKEKVQVILGKYFSPSTVLNFAVKETN